MGDNQGKHKRAQLAGPSADETTARGYIIV